ncbi:MAG: hypothetical protein LBU89_10180 [Fibromonadaceae bacterium]|jgi:hypothetical protein|nr:hypothetical protein [Fibromonadaceae bacterium]
MRITFPDNLFNIEKWKAFRGKYPPGSDIDHRIIIVFKHDNILKYFYVTSQVDNARKMARNDLQSLVCIKGDDWDELTKPSCIQCNKGNLFELSETEFRKNYAEGKVKVLGEIPESIRKSIVSAICSSKTFTDKEKAMYTV